MFNHLQLTEKMFDGRPLWQIIFAFYPKATNVIAMAGLLTLPLIGGLPVLKTVA